MNFCLRENNKTWSSLESERNTVRLHIDIDTICNQKCIYCYSRYNKSNWGLFMSKDYIYNTLFKNISYIYNELKKQNKILDIVLLCGEPTLHPYFNEIVKFLSSLNVRISITSNGSYGYKNIYSNDKIRWAFTYHPTQVYNIDKWFTNIISRKDEWWEVAISPLIDCLNNVKENSYRVYKIINLSHKYNLKVQPTFQFNPQDKITHIKLDNVIKYYSFLKEEYPIYKYNNTYMNDYEILTSKLNYIKGCLCVNNNVQLDVRGNLRKCCSCNTIDWIDLLNLNVDMVCPLDECTCYGFLTLYKEVI